MVAAMTGWCWPKVFHNVARKRDGIALGSLKQRPWDQPIGEVEAIERLRCGTFWYIQNRDTQGPGLPELSRKAPCTVSRKPHVATLKIQYGRKISGEVSIDDKGDDKASQVHAQLRRGYDEQVRLT
jgi:hypothetical protein